MASCSKQKVIKYKYSGVTITRIDKNAATYFYYGDYDRNYTKYNIKVEYSGFNNGIDAYLIFQPDKTVEIIHVMGKFKAESEYAKNSIQFKEVNNIQFLDWKDSLEGNLNNVIHIVDGLTDNYNTEKLLNMRNNSKVIASYPN